MNKEEESKILRKKMLRHRGSEKEIKKKVRHRERRW